MRRLSRSTYSYAVSRVNNARKCCKTHNTTVYDINERSHVLLEDVVLCGILIVAAGKSNPTNESIMIAPFRWDEVEKNCTYGKRKTCVTSRGFGTQIHDGPCVSSS